MAVALYAGPNRFTTLAQDRVTRHSFSFGEHYDPGNLGFGPLVAHNDDLLEPGGGYPEHPHSDLEIVTWVLSGALVHTDSTGRTGVVEPGHVQVLSAGAGIRHSEMADTASGPTRFVQAWVRPDVPGGAPAHRLDAAGVGVGDLVAVAGGEGLPLGTAGARLLVARLDPGAVVALPDDPLQHVFVAAGAVAVPSGPLGAGDALRVTDEPGLTVRAVTATELLVWSFRRAPSAPPA